MRKERFQIVFCLYNSLAKCQVIGFFAVYRCSGTGLLLSSTFSYLLHKFLYFIIQIPADCKLTHSVRYPGIVQLLSSTINEISDWLITCISRSIIIPFISICNTDCIKKLRIIIAYNRSCAISVLNQIVCRFQQSCITCVCLIIDQAIMVIIKSRIGDRCIIGIFKQQICLMRDLGIDLVDQHRKCIICGKLFGLRPVSSHTVLPYNFPILIPVQSFQV